MAYEKSLVIDNKVAGADLSARQYHFVKLNSSGQVVIVNGVTDIPHGVLQNAPASGETAEIALAGITKIVSDGTIAVGALIGTSGDGQAAAKAAGTDTTHYVLGRHLGPTAAAAGDIITCTIDCLAPSRAS